MWPSFGQDPRYVPQNRADAFSAMRSDGHSDCHICKTEARDDIDPALVSIHAPDGANNG